MDKGVLLPVDLFNKVVEYLSTRPYNEVASAIEEIRQAAKVIDVPKEETQNADGE